jgi:hypothetical protein
MLRLAYNFRKWYHVSRRNHGTHFLTERRGPVIKADNEPDTPRLCVASTVAACMSAMLFDKEAYVYRTVKPRRPVTPRNVWDQVITGERWLIPVPSIELELVEVISKTLLDEITAPTVLYIQKVKGPVNYRIRVAQYAHTINVLGSKYTNKAEKELITLWCKRFQIGDPVEYILQRAIEHDCRKT